ncbi:hypothetical protein DVH05_004590 [Phytophthora capsici]|nr:hypothetical protein DVH05_004590 [Phytophthora capsici]
MDRWQQSPFDPVQLYFNITIPTFQEEAQMMLEGLKLLAAVAFVDYISWKKLLLRNVGMALSEHWEEDTDNGSIVRLQLTIDKNDGSVQDLVQMCGGHQHDEPRREYSEALARIAAMDAKHDTQRRGVEILVPVVVFFDQDVPPHELVNLGDARRTCKWESSSLPPVQPGELRCTFVLTEVNVNLEDYLSHPIDLDIATKMHQLIYDNMWFSHISQRLDFSNKMTQPRKEVSGRLLTSFFGHSNESPIQCWDTSIRHQQLDRLSLEAVGQTRNDMEAICLAAIHSQTVKNLELSYTANSRDSVHWWKWVAYAFFSKRAQKFSSVQGLVLKAIGKVTAADIEAFCGILTSENPEKELFGWSCAHTDLQEATLTANSPILWNFDEFGKPVEDSGVVQFPSPIPFVWVMGESGQTEWMDALIPGYGRCQVRRRNLILNDPVDRTTRGNDLKALEIYLNSYSNARFLIVLPQFFAAVGSTLKLLTIGANYEDLDMEMVLEKCPNLEKLCLMQQGNTAIFNFSEYHAAGSPIPVFPFRCDDILALTDELMDPSSDLTKCLQRLTIHRYGYSKLEEKLDALLKMLENNGRLEYLYIRLFRTENYVERFKKFHLQPINHFVKLDTQRKIAFLSVLSPTSVPQSEKRQCQTRDKRRNWELFDANMVTNIFQFEAALALRKVYVGSN